MICLASPEASAKKSIVVQRIAGPQGARATRAVVRALRPHFRLVSAYRLHREARGRGRLEAARQLRVAGLVSGSIKRVGRRWVLRIRVSSGHSLRSVGRATFPLRGTRLGGASTRRVAWMIQRAMAQAKAGPPLRGRRVRVARARQPRVKPRPVQPDPLPVVAPQPERPVRRYLPTRRVVPTYGGRVSLPSGDDEDEDEYSQVPVHRGQANDEDDEVPAYVNPDPQGEAVRLRRRRRSGGSREAWESMVEASVGMMVLSRRMMINYPVGVTGLRTLPNFNSGILPAVRLEAALYPLVLNKRGPLANLGIVGRYWRMLGLEYHLDNVEPLRATLHTFELGVRMRWNVLGHTASPTLQLGLEFGRQAFQVQNDQALQLDFPNLAYVYLKLGPLALDWPVYEGEELLIGLCGSFEYLQIFSSGAIAETTAAGFGPEASRGLEVGLGLYGSYRGFFVRATGSYRRVFFSFDHACDGGCDGSAADIVAGAGLATGYAY